MTARRRYCLRGIDYHGVTVVTADGHRHELGRDDRMLERLDLAYAVKVHIVQGMTAENGIVLMNEREKALNTTQSFLVGVTRIADQAMLVVDNVKTPERDVTRNPGGKTRAIETGHRRRTTSRTCPSLRLNIGSIWNRLAFLLVFFYAPKTNTVLIFS